MGWTMDGELARMSRIIDQITPGCLLLCNESFASTNEREGSQIARQIIRALLARGIKMLFVTHLFDLAHSRLAGPLFRVRLEIPPHRRLARVGSCARGFEQRLEAQASATVTGPRIDSEMRRGRDYIRVALSGTVDAPDVAQAAAAAWSMIQLRTYRHGTWPVPRQRYGPRITP